MLLFALLACSEGNGLDSAADSAVPVVDTETPTACGVVDFQIDGPEAPRVGDSWTILLTCDEAIVTGAFRLAFTPPDFVAWDDITATFRRAGMATLTGQAGTRRATREVVVTQ